MDRKGQQIQDLRQNRAAFRRKMSALVTRLVQEYEKAFCTTVVQCKIRKIGPEDRSKRKTVLVEFVFDGDGVNGELPETDSAEVA